MRNADRVKFLKYQILLHRCSHISIGTFIFATGSMLINPEGLYIIYSYIVRPLLHNKDVHYKIDSAKESVHFETCSSRKHFCSIINFNYVYSFV